MCGIIGVSGSRTMLYETTTVALLPRMPLAAGVPGCGTGAGAPPRPASGGEVKVWLTSTLTFSGNETTFSRNVRA